MTDPTTNSTLDNLARYFELFPLSPAGWPVAVMAAVADARTKARWPNFPPAATLDHDRLGHGRGITTAEARRGAIGELVEVASCCDWGDLEVQRYAAGKTGKNTWGLALLNGFSQAQRAHRQDWNIRLKGLDRIGPDVDPNRDIEWLSACDAFSGNTIFVPKAAVVLSHRTIEDQDSFCVADTNGCAAGATLVSAQLSAVCELVERDALALWWYGGRAGSALAPRHNALAAKVAHTLRQQNRNLHLFDITSDLGIPTVAALASDTNGRCLSAGFATRLVHGDAIAHSLKELMQMELKTMMTLAGNIASPELDTWFASASLEDAPQISSNTTGPKLTAAGNLKLPPLEALRICLARIRRVGCRIAFIDFSRPEFNVPVARAVSPDLCHWKPRFGRSRLKVSTGESGGKLWRI